MTTQDFDAGLDPTNYQSVSGAELLQMVESGSPATERGMVVWTKDTAANTPVVPNPATAGYSKMKRYVWVREPFTTGATIIYVWNEYATSDATLLKWVVVTSSVLPGSITTTMLADGSVTTSKLANGAVTSDKLAAGIVPAQWYLIGSPAAGGDLAGNYPNPTIGAGKVTVTMLQAEVGYRSVQHIVTTDSTLKTADGSSAANRIPHDNTLPQNTEGVEYTELATAITPTRVGNKLLVTVCSNLAADGASTPGIAIFQDADANALAAVASSITASNNSQGVVVRAVVTVGALAATTFKVRFGPSGAQIAYINGNGVSQKYSTAGISSMTIEEIYV